MGSNPKKSNSVPVKTDSDSNDFLARLRAMDRQLNEHEMAEIVGIRVSTARRWRLLGEGPKFRKVGSSVRYRPDELAAWIESRPTGGGKTEVA